MTLNVLRFMLYDYAHDLLLKKKIWVKVFKNGPSKNCGRQPLKNLKAYGQLNFT